MKTQNIIIELEKIKNNYDLIKLENLIDTLKKDVLNEISISKGSSKKRISTIKKILSGAGKYSLTLGAVHLTNDKKYVFTDSYQFYKLNDVFLPFDVCFNEENSESQKKEYLKKHPDIKEVAGSYPTLKNIIPEKEIDQEYIEINIKEILAAYKTTLAKHGKKIYQMEKIAFDLCYMKNLINIFGLTENFKLEFHGEIRPLIYRNDSGEIGLIMPMKKY